MSIIRILHLFCITIWSREQPVLALSGLRTQLFNWTDSPHWFYIPWFLRHPFPIQQLLISIGSIYGSCNYELKHRLIIKTCEHHYFYFLPPTWHHSLIELVWTWGDCVSLKIKIKKWITKEKEVHIFSLVVYE